MYKVAVVGYGYWGPNIVRNFKDHQECEVKYIYDINPESSRRASKQNKDIDIIDDCNIIFDDKDIDIVAIVTPVSAHYPLAKKSLESGKHIFLEKPMTETVEQAKELIKIAKKKELVGVVDHTFLFTGAVMKIKEIIDSGEIGEITYFDSVRVNLGIFQHDVDVIWDLAPHDLSILFHLLKDKPNSLVASGVDHLNNGLVDIAYLNLRYEKKIIANFHINWLSPVKVRKILIGGSKKMIVYDDMKLSEKIKIYDAGIHTENPEQIYNLLISYRTGDVLSPNILKTEALKIEISEFIKQIKNKSSDSKNDLKNGKNIVKILEASKKSLKNNERVIL